VWDKLKNLDRRDHCFLIMDKLPNELKELSTEENAELWNKFIERRERFEQRKRERHDNNS
jgi:hypothetical protein